jgi:hypothetical protein
VVLICISFMARDSEHFFMCFLDIWISSFEKVLFSSVAHFFIESLILGELSFLMSLYTLVISPLSDVQLAKIFYHSVSGFFKRPFLLLCRSFLISHSLICQSFFIVAEPLDFY